MIPKKDGFKSIAVICLLIFLALSDLGATTITWTGGGGNNNWLNASNWDLNRIPIASDNVIIGTNTIDARVNSDVTIKSLIIEENAELEIWNVGRLVVDGSDNIGVIVRGTLKNYYQLHIYNSHFSGMYISGAGGNAHAYLHGTTYIDAIGSTGIIVGDNLTVAFDPINQFYTETYLSIQNTSGSAIQTLASGTINISEYSSGIIFSNTLVRVGLTNTSIGLDAITNSGDFNFYSGDIEINQADEDGITNTGSFTISSPGILNINQATERGISSSGVFTNHGLINIDNVTTDGLYSESDFVNHGIMNLGLVGPTDHAIAMYGANASFKNYGEIHTRICLSQAIRLDNQSSFFNHETGLVNIGQTGPPPQNFSKPAAGFALFQNGILKNIGGEINIDHCRWFSINVQGSDAVFENTDEGEIRIGANSIEGGELKTNGNSTNGPCSGITLEGNNVFTDDGSFVNEGWIYENSTGTSYVATNNGYIYNLNGGMFNVGSGNSPAIIVENAWLGAEDASWINPCNWSAGVPRDGWDVHIYTTSNDPVIPENTTVNVESIRVADGATLTIESGVVISLNSSNYGLHNIGVVRNNGQINFGMQSEMLLGVWSQGWFENASVGELHFGDVSQPITHGLIASPITPAQDSFINFGIIDVSGAFQHIRGIICADRFVNEVGGLIKLENSSNSGINTFGENSRMFENNGTIEILNAGIGILAEGDFINRETGEIQILQVQTGVESKVNLINDGTFDIGNSSTIIPNTGFDNMGIFENQENGQLNVVNAVVGILNNDTIINQGVLTSTSTIENSVDGVLSGGGKYRFSIDWMNEGVFIRDTSTVEAYGNDFAAISSADTFYNLMINKILNTTTSLSADIVIENELIMVSNPLNLAGHQLKLSNAFGTIVGEHKDSYIFSDVPGGLISKTKDLSNPNNSNPGNVGVAITTATDLGPTTIHRYHDEVAVGSDKSILRYYSIEPANNGNLDASLKIHFWDHELNGIAKYQLTAYIQPDSEWYKYPVCNENKGIHWVQVMHIDSLSTTTLAAQCLGSLPMLTGSVDVFQDYETDLNIKSTQIIGANNLTTVDYDAGTAIELTAGFEVALGSEFHAIIDGCNEGLRGGLGSVMDIDDNLYRTIRIGSQEWMAENLKTTRYNDGTIIPKVTDGGIWANLSTPAYCWYDNDSIGYASVHGALYNYYTLAETNSLNVCPIGWHAPSDAEFLQLEAFLNANGYGYEGSGNDIGKSLATKDGWDFWGNLGVVGNDQSSNNNSGFSASPGGFRHDYNGSFFNEGGGGLGNWWTSSSYSEYIAFKKTLFHYEDILFHSTTVKQSGLSIRCLKD